MRWLDGITDSMEEGGHRLTSTPARTGPQPARRRLREEAHARSLCSRSRSGAPVYLSAPDADALSGAANEPAYISCVNRGAPKIQTAAEPETHLDSSSTLSRLRREPPTEPRPRGTQAPRSAWSCPARLKNALSRAPRPQSRMGRELPGSLCARAAAIIRRACAGAWVAVEKVLRPRQR